MCARALVRRVLPAVALAVAVGCGVSADGVSSGGPGPGGVSAGGAGSGGAAAGDAAAAAADWAVSWTGSAMSPSPLVARVRRVRDRTVRNVVQLSAGGAELRIRVSNAFGDRPLTVGAVTVARQLRGAALDPATLRPVTFGGRPAVTLAAGAAAVSDPVRLAVPALSTLAVSLYLPGATGPLTYHQAAMQYTYLARGDRAADPDAGAFTARVGHWFLVDAVQVRGPARGAIVAVGDSITDGVGGQPGAHTRWPDFLARILVRRYGPAAPAVVNAGISGNRVLNGSVCFGEDLLSRLERDVFGHPGVRAVVLLQGVNDLGFSQKPDAGCARPNTEVTAEQLIAAYRRVIERARAGGVRIYGGTIPPVQGFGYWNAAAETKRRQVNEWIRTSGAFDGVIDFAAALAYPGRPELLDPRYDSGDHIHPNAYGYQVMAETAARVLAGSAF